MLSGLATANLLLGNFAEALDWSKKLYFEGGSAPPTFWILAACAGYAGDLALAQEAIRKLQERYPEWTLATVRHYYETHVRYRRQKDIDRIIEGLRLAGLRE